MYSSRADERSLVHHRAVRCRRKALRFSALTLLTSSWRVAPNRLAAEHLHKLPVRVAIIRGQALSQSISKTPRPPSRCQYGIVGPAFLYIDRDTRPVTTMFGYPTRKLAQMAATGAGRSHSAIQLLSGARAKISNIFG